MCKTRWGCRCWEVGPCQNAIQRHTKEEGASCMKCGSFRQEQDAGQAADEEANRR
jgi:hypothetical protein